MAANPKFMNEKATTFKLNGNEIDAYGDETILQAAKRNDIETIKNHLNLLSKSQQELYLKITQSIQNHGKEL